MSDATCGVWRVVVPAPDGYGVDLGSDGNRTDVRNLGKYQARSPVRSEPMRRKRARSEFRSSAWCFHSCLPRRKLFGFAEYPQGAVGAGI